MKKDAIKTGAILVQSIEATQNALTAFKESYAVEPATSVALDCATGEEIEVKEERIELYVAINHNAGVKVMSEARQKLIYDTCVEEMQETIDFLESKLAAL